MAKSLLVISRQAPWSGPSAREALDIVLAGGAFDLPIGLLLLDDGVFQLANFTAPNEGPGGRDECGGNGRNNCSERRFR